MSAAVLVAGIVCAAVVAIAAIGSALSFGITRRRLWLLDLETLPPEVVSLRVAGLKEERADLARKMGYALAPSLLRRRIDAIDAELVILCRTPQIPPVQKGQP